MIAAENWQVIQSVLSPLRKSQRKTVTLVVQAIAYRAEAASFQIAAFLSQVTGSRLDSALLRFYRLLHNPRLDDLKITQQLLSLLAQKSHSLLVALDWTEWHPPLRMLLASVVVGHRAIPVQAAVFSKGQIVRSQNTWENNFLTLFSLLLDDLHISVCFLADRGFRRVSFLKLLQAQNGHSFLVRIGDQVTVENQKGKRLLRCSGLQPGHAVDLGEVRVRQDGATTLRVIGIWAKGKREPWWLATNRTDSLSSLAALYDRRMAIEEQIRDTKGARFGLQLVWTQIQTPQALARFMLLIGLAILVLTAIGHALAQRRADIRLPCKTKGPRLSLLSVGYLFLDFFLEKRTLSLTLLHKNIPPPNLRSFAWLDGTANMEDP